jgi:hypothetical protein
LNAVEIEELISKLAERPFDRDGFPYSFLEAFGNKETTIKRLRSGTSNKSDLGGVLQTNKIHIAPCAEGGVTEALKASPATAKAKAKFILATDGVDFEAEDLASGETVACAYRVSSAKIPSWNSCGLFPSILVMQAAENRFGNHA